jgi:hypothetical protein
VSDISFTTGGVPGSVRTGGAFESLVGETVSLPFAATYVDGAGADGVTIAGNELRFTHTPGRRRFRSADGGLEVIVVACEPAILARLPHGERPGGGHGHADARMILRALAAHTDWFTGRASDLDNLSLAPFGGWTAPAWQ